MPTKTVKAGKSEKASSVRVKKDKNAPKPARSAYTFFLEEVHVPLVLSSVLFVVLMRCVVM